MASLDSTTIGVADNYNFFNRRQRKAVAEDSNCVGVNEVELICNVSVNKDLFSGEDFCLRYPRIRASYPKDRWILFRRGTFIVVPFLDVVLST